MRRKRKVSPSEEKSRGAKEAQDSAARCGLCGKTGKLMRTECCRQWICDDEENYVLFSYARNSCARNHRRYTLCGSHAAEEHSGDWWSCDECRTGCETEMYVWYGTNEFNFRKLEDPPSYKPTLCGQCKKRIRLAHDSYSMKGGQYICERCFMRDFARR